MRLVFAVLISLMAGSAFTSAKADPYKWCAIMGGGETAVSSTATSSHWSNAVQLSPASADSAAPI